MSVSYLDVVHTIWSNEGITYGDVTKAMRVHIRSLVADGFLAAVLREDESVHTTLDDPEGVVWFTASGADYVEMLIGAGLVAAPVETVQEEPEAPVVSEPSVVEPPVQETVKRRSARKGRKAGKVSRSQGSPSAREHVESPVLPEGVTATRVPGNHHGDQLLLDSTVPTVEDLVESMAALQRTVSALTAVVLA